MKKILKMFFGKKNLQGAYEFLHKYSLKGMNFGDSEVSESGEAYVLEYLKKKSQTEVVTLFDVGANQGQYANLAYRVWGDRAMIYSFEPGKMTYEMLEHNTSGISNIKRFNLAVGATEGESELHYDEAGSGLASLYERKLDHTDLFLDKTEKVKISTIDLFCTKHNISSIDFLKIDVEGHELDVLKGAEKMLSKKSIMAIQFEFGGANIDSRTYFQDFFNLLKDDYRIYRILKDDLREIDRYSELDEIFTTVNYFAELR